MIVADGFLGLGLEDRALEVVRIIATIGGAVVGWFGCDPLTRLIYRLSFRKPTPSAVLFFSKATAAVLLAVLIYKFIPLGGGGSGFGLGPGPGGGPGKGPGAGGGDGPSDGKGGKDPLKSKDGKSKGPSGPLEPIEIEIISIKLYKDDGKERFYLLDRKPPAVSLGDLEKYFKDRHGKIEVTPILTPNSFDDTPAYNPLSRLLELTEKCDIKTLQTKRE